MGRASFRLSVRTSTSHDTTTRKLASIHSILAPTWEYRQEELLLPSEAKDRVSNEQNAVVQEQMHGEIPLAKE